MAILNSKIIMAKGIKMDREYNNVLSFGTNRILAILNSNEHYVSSSNTFSFIGGKNTKIISTPFTYEQCLQSNYIAFQNPSYSNKWFFAFITNVIYKSNGNTQIEFEIDAWSTWFENWVKKPCYIIREHVNNDTIGANTVPENLDVGDLICDYYRNDNTVSVDEWFWIVVASNYDPTSGGQWAGFSYHDGYPQGCQWFAFKVSAIVPIDGYNQANAWLASVASADHVADIQGMFVLPRKCDRRFRS